MFRTPIDALRPTYSNNLSTQSQADTGLVHGTGEVRQAVADSSDSARPDLPPFLKLPPEVLLQVYVHIEKPKDKLAFLNTCTILSDLCSQEERETLLEALSYKDKFRAIWHKNSAINAADLTFLGKYFTDLVYIVCDTDTLTKKWAHNVWFIVQSTKLIDKTVLEVRDYLRQPFFGKLTVSQLQLFIKKLSKYQFSIAGFLLLIIDGLSHEQKIEFLREELNADEQTINNFRLFGTEGYLRALPKSDKSVIRITAKIYGLAF